MSGNHRPPGAFEPGPMRQPLARRRATTPERTALVETETGETWTYDELATRAALAGTGFRRELAGADEPVDGLDGPIAGPDRPDRHRVGYLLPPGPEFVATLYGLWGLGWTAVGLHADLTREELATQAATADLDALVFDAELAPQVDSFPCRTIPVESLFEGAADGAGTEGAEEAPVEWGADETALVLFTSGSTGEPRGVRLTLGNLLASATASAFRLGVGPDDRWLCCLPVSHMGGLAPVVRTAIYGTTLLTQREFDAAETARILSEYRATDVSLVPTQLKRLLDAGWHPHPALGTVLLGGAPATDALLERAFDAGVPAYPTYGMTETASQVATARPVQVREYPGTVGQPLVWTQVTILDGDEPVGPGERGEIVVSGPTVTPGYLDEQPAVDDGFVPDPRGSADEGAAPDGPFGEYGFHTGDVGYRDEAGRLWVVGRHDDVILTGGELVSPHEVVETLLTHPEVEDAAVVGVPDEEWGERVEALVVPAEDERPAEATLREHCRARLAGFKVPKRVTFAEAIPRTASGTVDREAARRRLEAGQP